MLPVVNVAPEEYETEEQLTHVVVVFGGDQPVELAAFLDR